MRRVIIAGVAVVCLCVGCLCGALCSHRLYKNYMRDNATIFLKPVGDGRPVDCYEVEVETDRDVLFAIQYSDTLRLAVSPQKMELRKVKLYAPGVPLSHCECVYEKTRNVTIDELKGEFDFANCPQ